MLSISCTGTHQNILMSKRGFCNHSYTVTRFSVATLAYSTLRFVAARRGTCSDVELNSVAVENINGTLTFYTKSSADPLLFICQFETNGRNVLFLESWMLDY